MSDPAFEAEIRDLIGRNQKIMAVKLYRERTGVGLAEAKAAVEAVQAGRSVPHALAPTHHAAPPSPPPSANEPMEVTVARLIREDRKLDAIKWVRERTGIGLADAKQWVDAIQANRVVAPPGPQHAAVVQVNADSPNSADAELLEVARRDGKIEAIKLHRTRFGSGLADAKNYVDGLLDRASRGAVVTLPATPKYAAMPANPPPPSAFAQLAPPVAPPSAFGSSSDSARSALEQAPLPETMPTWVVNPPAVASSYVPRERKGFGNADSDRNLSQSAALGTFVVMALVGLLALAGMIAFLTLR